MYIAYLHTPLRWLLRPRRIRSCPCAGRDGRERRGRRVYIQLEKSRDEDETLENHPGDVHGAMLKKGEAFTLAALSIPYPPACASATYTPLSHGYDSLLIEMGTNR